MKHLARPTGYGGVAVIYKSTLTLSDKKVATAVTFECLCLNITSSYGTDTLCAVYRPPRSDKNQFKTSDFLDQFETLVESLSIEPGRLFIAGDFNFQIDNPQHKDSCKFKTLLRSLSLKQHVRGSTQDNGHTLDLFITRIADNVTVQPYVENPGFSDHSAVHLRLPLSKPELERKEISYRKLRSIDKESFSGDIQESSFVSSATEHGDINDIVSLYNSSLSGVLDNHAPLCKRVLTIRPNSPWFNDELQREKRLKHSLERQVNPDQPTTDECQVAYRAQANKYYSLIDQAKQEYYKDRISSAGHDQKKLFNTVDTLLNGSNNTPLPLHSSADDLSERFVDFFVDKIDSIRTDLLNKQKSVTSSSSFVIPPFDGEPLSAFTPVSEEALSKIIAKSPTKSCSLDPIPTWLLKENIDVLLPSITHLVNCSLSTSCMPSLYKDAVVTPILKKASLPPDSLKNYRPVSNLPYLSKVIEKAAASQLQDHLAENNIDEKFQSAYKRLHSTETATLRVQNDILRLIDDKKCVLLVLLDLSAAFDTIDHDLLLDTLEQRFGVTDDALSWFRSYLSGRVQRVCVKHCFSKGRCVTCGVPQGSVLGPLLFVLYTFGLGDILRRYGIEFHLYADDSQLYLSFSLKDPTGLDTTTRRLEECITVIREWMTVHFLKLNEEKTEFIMFISRYARESFPSANIRVGDDTVSPVRCVRNLGAFFDSYLSMTDHISQVTRSAYYHIRRISSIRKFLTRDATERVVHAFITSKLDTNNALLYGLDDCQLKPLEKLQNSAARLVTGARKYDHITPVLQQLHWLPIKARIIFKICLIVYKCLHGLAPAYLSDVITVVNHDRNLRSRLHVPKARIGYGDRAFSICGPRTWNLLPSHIRTAETLEAFKKKLKTHLFDDKNVKKLWF